MAITCRDVRAKVIRFDKALKTVRFQAICKDCGQVSFPNLTNTGMVSSWAADHTHLASRVQPLI